MPKEYRVMMADFPVSGIFKKKANSLEAAWKIVKYYQSKATPYQQFYVEEWNVELVEIHHCK